MSDEARAAPVPIPLETGWIEKARGGDRAAFDRIVEAHLGQVWAVVARIVRRREDAEDVVQEVFLTAWRSLAGFRGEAAFSTWLHRIAVTRALNHVTRASERMSRVSSPLEGEAEDAGPDPTPEVERVAATGATPLRALESKELLRRLRLCLEKLPAPWTAVIALRDAESMSYEEIARALGVELGTVRSRLARARSALRDCVTGRSS
jgi:RNA polymerase sigma-70 factor (ECF subfamily)